MDLLYHEKQVAALCGVHCLNTLLQGPYFSEVDLAKIGQELDEMERQFMLEGGMSQRDLHALQEQLQGNVSNDGMFNIQVLERALQLWHLDCIPVDNLELRKQGIEPQAEQAYICNLEEHWFTLRNLPQLGWYNFNSLFPAPQALGTLYLSTFLATLRQRGYTLFVVRGSLPQPHPPVQRSSASGCMWVSAEEAKRLNDDAASSRAQGAAMAVFEDAAAMASASGQHMRLRSRHQPAAAGSGLVSEQQLQQAIAESLAQQNSHPELRSAAAASSPPLASGTASASLDPESDLELAAALAASLEDCRPAVPDAEAGPAAEGPVDEAPLEEEPEPGEGVVTVGFRLPSGARLQRRFARTDSAATILRYLQSQRVDPKAHRIVMQYPRRELADGARSLAEYGVGDKEMLLVERQ